MGSQNTQRMEFLWFAGSVYELRYRSGLRNGQAVFPSDLVEVDDPETEDPTPGTKEMGFLTLEKARTRKSRMGIRYPYVYPVEYLSASNNKFRIFKSPLSKLSTLGVLPGTFRGVMGLVARAHGQWGIKKF